MGDDSSVRNSAALLDNAEVNGKYRVLFQLGQGGTATVHLAVARGASGFNKLVVLKVPRRSVAADGGVLSMFTTEARLSARLSHPNVVQTNEITEIRGLPIIVMEYLEGRPLSDLVAANKRLPLKYSLRILIDALNGLHYAHEATDFDGVSLNVVHRDMTPHNVFITFTGQVKILDFGIAKLERNQEKTDTGVIKGKIRYMPPEQIAGEAVDRRADIYAVGVMLWEAAAGKPIFEGLKERSILNQVLNGEVPTPSSQTTEPVDPELERIAMKALSMAPEDRYNTAAELQAELEHLQQLREWAVTDRELGAFVSETFHTEIAETRHKIEDLLRDTAVQSWSASSVTTATPSTTGGFRRTLPFIAIPAIGVLVALAVWLSARTRATSSPEEHLATEPSVSAATSSPGSARGSALSTQLPTATSSEASARIPTSVVALSLDIRPKGAKVYLDDVLVENLDSAPNDGKPHTLRVEAKGYLPWTKTLTFKEDTSLKIALDPAKTAPTTQAPSATVKTPTGDCNPPYVINERGIKTFKPQCLN
ncbi:MAG: serine/threonine-protein kinase [Polyangiaceae bacterium]